jgi:hypothetical protein
MEALPEQLARKTVKRYACSICWGELEMRPAIHLENGFYFVVCKKCQDETRGYVTQYFVNRRRGESEFEKRDALNLLRKLHIIPDIERSPMRPGETAIGRNLRELGF